jgi:hypothetical protein
LLTRIESLRERLRAARLPRDERDQALKLLLKARKMALGADTPEDRGQLSKNLDMWERRFLD